MLTLLLALQGVVVPVDDAGPARHARLFPSQAALYGDVEFGRAAAVDGDRLVVGMPDFLEPGLMKGRAVFFERDAEGRFVETFEFAVPTGFQDEGGRVGWSVALEGDLAVIGHPEATEPGPIPSAGRAWVLERRPDAVWEVLDVLRPPGAPVEQNTRFGNDVALDGDRLAVGARLGGTSVYRRQPDGYFALEQQLDSTGVPAIDLDLEGDHLVLGGHHWRREAGGWVDAGELTGVPGYFPTYPPIALHQGRLALGSVYDDVAGWKTGAVHCFELDATGELIYARTLRAPAPVPGDAFGSAVAWAGDALWVSALRDDASGPDRGTVWRLRDDDGDGTWTADGRVTGDPAADTFGYTLAADGATLVVGDPWESTASDSILHGSPSGTAHVHALEPWTASPATVSGATGGLHQFQLAAGEERAGLPYLVLGGTSGPLALLDDLGRPRLPFVTDAYTDALLVGAGDAPWPGCTGLTDPLGRATAALQVPPLPPSAVGLVARHAALVLDPLGPWPLVTDAVELTVVP